MGSGVMPQRRRRVEEWRLVLKDRRAVAAAVVGLSLLPLELEGKERRWMEFQTPHFTVLCDSGQKTARKVAWRFEQVHSVFGMLWPWARLESSRPFIVLAVKGEAGLKDLAPHYWERKGYRPTSVAVSGPDKDYVVLRSDLGTPSTVGVNPYFSAYFGYANIVMNASFDAELPLWFRRGIAGLFGNTVVRKDGIDVGRMRSSYVDRLRKEPRISLREHMAVERGSRHREDETLAARFDAQAWLLVHYLLFADDGANRAKFDHFTKLLLAGTPSDTAFDEAIGSIEELDAAIDRYLTKKIFQYVTVAADVGLSKDAFRSRPSSDAEALVAKAGFHVAMRREREAEGLLDRARKIDAALPEIPELEGMLRDRADQRDAAIAAYSKAVELKSVNVYVLNRLAYLLWSPEADAETLARIATTLERLIRIHSMSAEGHAFLATVVLRQTREATDEAGDERALGLIQRAVELSPREPRYRLTLSRALWRANRPDEARGAAQLASAWAKNDELRIDAEELLSFYERAAQSSRQ